MSVFFPTSKFIKDGFIDVVLRFKKAMQMTIIIHGLCPDTDLIGKVSKVYCKAGDVSITLEIVRETWVREGRGNEKGAGPPRAAHRLRFRHSHGGT